MENFFSLDLCTPEKPEKSDRMGEEIVKTAQLSTRWVLSLVAVC